MSICKLVKGAFGENGVYKLLDSAAGGDLGENRDLERLGEEEMGNIRACKGRSSGEMGNNICEKGDIERK